MTRFGGITRFDAALLALMVGFIAGLVTADHVIHDAHGWSHAHEAAP